MPAIRLKDFENWLKKYGDAWEKGDPGVTESLFTSDARYYETPFEDPMIGVDEIYKYWKDNAMLDQEDIHFSYEGLAVYKNVGVHGIEG